MNTAKSIVCTVFERTYHYGVGALVNSLYSTGYRGIVYAGYRGQLPPWTDGALTEIDGVSVFHVAEGLDIHFAFQDTDQMLANIKPELIEQVWERYGDAVENVFYFDCDIMVKARWQQFEEWAEFGVALCEDINSPINRNHPLRTRWKRYYAEFDINYEPRDDTYVNGGFVGVNRKFRDFVPLWEKLQDYMRLYTGKQNRIGIADRWNMFHYMDQDALNVAKDLSDEVSIMGRDAMDFSRFGYVMSHAAGRHKPWQKKYLREIFATGARPSFSDKLYWQHVEYPIRLYPDGIAKRKRVAMRVAGFFGRFFTRV